ncbi:hypothetical protein M9Y10_023483 [Tritrichomonas musculus]|uniref:BZIP domain-containing protein n=1 Tax=Tritrichomonas musculus TaxID=1915356 RepID=A0ABR2KW56_9EUKA
MQVSPSELRFFMQPSFQDNSFFMQPNILLPPLKVKQPVAAPATFTTFSSIPPLTPNSSHAHNSSNLNNSSVQSQSLILNPLNPNPGRNAILNVHNYNSLPVQPQMVSNIVYPQPNLTTSSSNASDSGSSEDESEEESPVKGQRKVLDATEKKDLKERNRIAAQKWRKKKDKYLTELESANDVLRQQALSLCGQMQALRVENKLLEDELQFFQSFMSKIMHVAPKH